MPVPSKTKRPARTARRFEELFDRKTSADELALGELEALTGTWATGLLTFFRTGIASEQASLFQHWTKLCVNGDQSARNAETNRTDLTRHTTTIGVDCDVISLVGVSELQGEQNLVLKSQRREVFFEAATVNGDLAIAFTEKHTCDCGFAASSGA
jgi:hypothetical protein